jgi:hypothetical protein
MGTKFLNVLSDKESSLFHFIQNENDKGTDNISHFIVGLELGFSDYETVKLKKNLIKLGFITETKKAELDSFSCKINTNKIVELNETLSYFTTDKELYWMCDAFRIKNELKQINRKEYDNG